MFRRTRMAPRDLQVAPPQWWSETREIGIGGDPFASAFDCHSRVSRAGNDLSSQ